MRTRDTREGEKKIKSFLNSRFVHSNLHTRRAICAQSFTQFYIIDLIFFSIQYYFICSFSFGFIGISFFFFVEFQWHTFKWLSSRILSSIRFVDDNDNLPKKKNDVKRERKKKKHLKGNNFFDTTSFSS